jgi:hypothetical protein
LLLESSYTPKEDLFNTTDDRYFDEPENIEERKFSNE